MPYFDFILYSDLAVSRRRSRGYGAAVQATVLLYVRQRSEQFVAKERTLSVDEGYANKV